MTHEPLAAGLYESLVTSELRAALTNAEHVELGEVDSADAPHVLARHVYEIAQRRLRDVRDHDKRLALVNRLLVELGEPTEALESPASQLLRIAPPVGPGAPSYGDTRPSTPLADAALLTNAHGEPNLGGELRAEMDTADEVDLLCAFVKWHGLRLLEPELRRLRTRRAPLRVITTTYVGATERRALDRLVREFGAEVKVQYDAQRTRLHAKAWMFGRASGFDTAYVGSSNLSKAALLDGVEWNVRLSRVGTPSLLAKFAATFDTYWNDSSYELYDPDRDGDRLDDALAEASGRLSVDRVTVSLSGLEVRPYPYQQEMLDALDAERVVHGRRRNLVVAATGTGKTVVAALDYRRLCDEATGARPRLLFVAHRQEILRQSLRTYREVLNDASFGELYVDGTRPERWEHVFASVQSLSSYGVDEIPPDAFDVVVIDEFHHAAASSYRRLLDHLQPRELLGLTATPERADGVNVRDAFFDGRIATELRLWDALGADLLCPFHYFAVGDNTDLSRLSWTSGRYDGAELSNLYTADDARARIILRELADKVLDPGAMRRWVLRRRSPRRLHDAHLQRRRPSCSHCDRSDPIRGTRPDHRRPSRATGQHRLHRRRVQRGPRRSVGRHGALPAPDGKRDDLPATARARASSHPRQGSADGSGLRRAPAQEVPLGPQAACTDGTHPGRRGAGDQARFPVPTLWQPDRDGRACAGRRPRQHPLPGRVALVADRRRASRIRRHGAAYLPT